MPIAWDPTRSSVEHQFRNGDRDCSTGYGWSLQLCVGTHALPATGKFYWEIQWLDTVDGRDGQRHNLQMGMVDLNRYDPEQNGLGDHHDNSLTFGFADDGAVLSGTGYRQMDLLYTRDDEPDPTQYRLVNVGPTIPLTSQGDLPEPPYNPRYMFAADQDNGLFWIGRDGSWLQGNGNVGNPATGLFPVFDYRTEIEAYNPGANPPIVWAPAYNGHADRWYTSFFEHSQWLYPPPAGYTDLSGAAPMPWPSGSPPTEHYNAGSDKPDLARDELLQLAQDFVDAMVQARGAIDGVAALNASGQIPVGQIPLADVPRGGTGRTTLTNHAVLVGADAGAVQQVGPGAAGAVLTGNGPSAPPTFQQVTSGVMVGSCVVYFGLTEPANYMWPDGRAISRSTYADLFAVIGTTYGSGDGSTTFNIPDLRGRAVFGLDDMGGTSANRVTHPNADQPGGTLGGESQTLIEGNHAPHRHGPEFANEWFRMYAPDKAVWQNPGGGSDYSDSAWTGLQGSGAAFSIIPPALFSFLIMRVLA